MQPPDLDVPEDNKVIVGHDWHCQDIVLQGQYMLSHRCLLHHTAALGVQDSHLVRIHVIVDVVVDVVDASRH